MTEGWFHHPIHTPQYSKQKTWHHIAKSHNKIRSWPLCWQCIRFEIQTKSHTSSMIDILLENVKNRGRIRITEKTSSFRTMNSVTLSIDNNNWIKKNPKSRSHYPNTYFLRSLHIRHALKKFKLPLWCKFLNLISFESGPRVTKTIIVNVVSITTVSVIFAVEYRLSACQWSILDRILDSQGYGNLYGHN